jgi:hypothetical protein
LWLVESWLGPDHFFSERDFRGRTPRWPFCRALWRLAGEVDLLPRAAKRADRVLAGSILGRRAVITLWMLIWISCWSSAMAEPFGQIWRFFKVFSGDGFGEIRSSRGGSSDTGMGRNNKFTVLQNLIVWLRHATYASAFLLGRLGIVEATKFRIFKN